ncbi:MAG: hypothetical protein NXY57DRAFT_492178 [Lentinula lateritia]|nr:MAG: hypothetical protein NXY57DRAFT_492178 [Lentinula lateritia]
MYCALTALPAPLLYTEAFTVITRKQTEPMKLEWQALMQPRMVTPSPKQVVLSRKAALKTSINNTRSLYYRCSTLKSLASARFQTAHRNCRRWVSYLRAS